MNPSTNLLSLSKNLKNKSLFTDAEWDVVTYIDEHQAEVSQMNIGVLKEKTYVSNGTIIRICRKLGYDGFKTCFSKECRISKIYSLRCRHQSALQKR